MADQHCDFDVNPVVADPATAPLDGTVDAVLDRIVVQVQAFRRALVARPPTEEQPHRLSEGASAPSARRDPPRGATLRRNVASSRP